MCVRHLLAPMAAALVAVLLLSAPVAIAAPSGPYGGMGCVVSKRVVRQGTGDAIFCRRLPKNAKGRLTAKVRQRKYPHRRHGHRGPLVTRTLVLKRFRTGRRGNALFAFRVPRALRPGRRILQLTAGRKRTHVVIVVKRARRP